MSGKYLHIPDTWDDVHVFTLLGLIIVNCKNCRCPLVNDGWLVNIQTTTFRNHSVSSGIKIVDWYF